MGKKRKFTIEIDIVALLCYNEQKRISMSLDATVRARIDVDLKKDVEKILSEIGITTSQAITMFMKGIKRERGIPMELKIPNALTMQVIEDARNGINMEEVTLEEMTKEREA
jgi:DNA-damage-inducible protein J